MEAARTRASSSPSASSRAAREPGALSRPSIDLAISRTPGCGAPTASSGAGDGRILAQRAAMPGPSRTCSAWLSAAPATNCPRTSDGSQRQRALPRAPCRPQAGRPGRGARMPPGGAQEQPPTGIVSELARARRRMKARTWAPTVGRDDVVEGAPRGVSGGRAGCDSAGREADDPGRGRERELRRATDPEAHEVDDRQDGLGAGRHAEAGTRAGWRRRPRRGTTSAVDGCREEARGGGHDLGLGRRTSAEAADQERVPRRRS